MLKPYDEMRQIDARPFCEERDEMTYFDKNDFNEKEYLKLLN